MGDSNEWCALRQIITGPLGLIQMRVCQALLTLALLKQSIME